MELHEVNPTSVLAESNYTDIGGSTGGYDVKEEEVLNIWERE